MTDTAHTGLSWHAALKVAEGFVYALPDQRDKEGIVRGARDSLKDLSPSWRASLIILGSLDTDFTVELVDDLVNVALSTKHTVAVRELIGRLPYGTAEKVVPPAVWRLLDNERDDGAYYRMAELLDHLGLRKALKQLCSKAQDSDDPDVREVAASFSDDQ